MLIGAELEVYSSQERVYVLEYVWTCCGLLNVCLMYIDLMLVVLSVHADSIDPDTKMEWGMQVWAEQCDLVEVKSCCRAVLSIVMWSFSWLLGLQYQDLGFWEGMHYRSQIGVVGVEWSSGIKCASQSSTCGHPMYRYLIVLRNVVGCGAKRLAAS